ncbi:MAG: hypothetical protein EP329_07375 [Deltaproteobacteria bacterium]|nr:MAG: hypothetical protein EP329_07375 [Deltaproteobacteria bacterium]
MMRLQTGGVWLVAVATLALGACGDDGTTVDPRAELEEHVCEHFDGGDTEAVTAGAEAAAAVDVTGTHTRYDITLVDVGGALGGYVSIAIDEASEYAIFVSADVGVEVTDATGAVVTPEESFVGSDVCAPIGASTHVALGVGTYTIALGPTAESTVQLVYVEPGHDHEGEE